MAIICFNEKLTISYVPRFGGNRESEKQAIVGIKPLNNDGSIEFTRNLNNKLVACGDDVDKQDNTSKEMAKQVFLDHVAWVKGCQYMNEKEELVDIKTAKELYDHASRGLINEISLAIENSSTLSAGQLKN